MSKKLLMGNEAMAHAALEAGVGVVAGYPGTPASEIVETVARERARGAAHDVHVEWSANEKVALELLFGASLVGKRALFACRQAGLNVASDALMSLNYVGVRGGLVLIVADDPGPQTSQTEQDTRRFAMFAKVPVLDPDTPEQACEMVKAAFELSEHFRTPVIVRPTTHIDHASSFFEVEDETFALPALEGGFQRDPSRHVIFPRRSYEAHQEINKRLADMAGVFSTEPTFASFNGVEESGEAFSGRPTFGIMAGGVSASYVREALRIVSERAIRAGIGVPVYRFMQVGTPYPFPEKAVSQFITGLSNVLVIEELDCVLEDQLAMMCGRLRTSLIISGKRTDDARDCGENDIDDIIVRIERFLGLTGRLSLHRLRGDRYETASVQLDSLARAELPDRPPVMCAGCPHRGAFYAVKQAIGDDPVVMCGDIGCHMLGGVQPLDAIDTCLCMGAGITMAQGITVADPVKKAIAYIGDSAFFASGLPGMVNAAHNGHDVTVMVLDNATTAGTGGQSNPGTGRTLMNRNKRPLNMEMILVANGFGPVYHANPFDRDASVIAVRAAMSYEGPSAVIFEGMCAKLVEPKPPVSINNGVCTGCKRCITGIGCPAIGFNVTVTGPRSRGRGQAVVDPTLCTGCGLCTQVCPFHAILADPSVLRSAQASRMLEAESMGLTRLAGARRVVRTEDVFGQDDADAATGLSDGENGFADGALVDAFDDGFAYAFGDETRLLDGMRLAQSHDGEGEEPPEIKLGKHASNARSEGPAAAAVDGEGPKDAEASGSAEDAEGVERAADADAADAGEAYLTTGSDAAPEGDADAEGLSGADGIVRDVGADTVDWNAAGASAGHGADQMPVDEGESRPLDDRTATQAAGGLAQPDSAPDDESDAVAVEQRLALDFGEDGLDEGAMPEIGDGGLPVVEIAPTDGYDDFDAMFDAFKDEPPSAQEGGSRD